MAPHRFKDQTGIRARTLEAMWRLDGHTWLQSDGDWQGPEMPNWILLRSQVEIGPAHEAMLGILRPHMERTAFTLAYFAREEDGHTCLVFLDGNAAILAFAPDLPLSPYRLGGPSPFRT